MDTNLATPTNHSTQELTPTDLSLLVIHDCDHDWRPNITTGQREGGGREGEKEGNKVLCLTPLIDGHAL